jgi:PD-(D/E)XK nuclease superfamily protein
MTASITRPGLATAKLGTVSASRYGALQSCVLREAAQVGRQPPLMPEPPRAALGTAIHKLFERAASDPDFLNSEEGLSREWNRAIADVEEFLSASDYMAGLLPLSRSIPNLGLMRSRTVLRLLEGVDHVPEPRIRPGFGRIKAFPRRLANKAGTVLGIPDRIDQTPAGIVILDYKTGVTADTRGAFWRDYELQLKLYSTLYYISRGRWPARLELHGLDSSIHEIPFSPVECSELLASAEALAANISVITGTLGGDTKAQIGAATPSSETCRHCSFRPACPAYLSSTFRDGPLCETDVEGALRNWKTLGNGEYLIELERPGGVVRVRNLPPVAHLTAALRSAISGQKMIVFNVVKSHEPSPLFSPTAFTALHIYCEGRQ